MNALSSGEILNRILINDQEIINWYADYTFPKLREKIEYLLSGSDIQKKGLKEISKSFCCLQFINFRNEILQNQEKYKNSLNENSFLDFSVQKIFHEKKIYEYVNSKISEFVNKQYWENKQHPETRSINIEQISNDVFDEFRKKIENNALKNYKIGFLRRICRNKTITFIKKKLKYIKTDVIIEQIKETNEPDMMTQCDEILQDILTEADYKSVIVDTEKAHKKVLMWLMDKANISEREVQLLNLDIVLEVPQDKIATIMGYSSNTVVKSSKRRIMKKLRDFLCGGGLEGMKM